MSELSIDLVGILAKVRNQAVAMAEGGWSELGTLISSILPDPLNPIALIPIATGKAVGGRTSLLISAAAAVTLIDVSLRIVDDCADRDDPDALYHSIGVGRAVNYAMTLNTIATRELLHVHLPPDRLDGLLHNYFRSFLQVCQGQDYDMHKQVKTLAEYQEIVTRKTIAAYEFAALAGALIATSDTNAIALCARCGMHLGWMTQILDDIEALWFPVIENDPEIGKLTFPVLFALTTDHPDLQILEKLYHSDRIQICALLDEMNVRTRLMHVALDHRDAAIASLGGSFHPKGSTILRLWLDWLLGDGARLLGIV